MQENVTHRSLVKRAGTEMFRTIRDRFSAECTETI